MMIMYMYLALKKTQKKHNTCVEVGVFRSKEANLSKRCVCWAGLCSKCEVSSTALHLRRVKQPRRGRKVRDLAGYNIYYFVIHFTYSFPYEKM